MRTCVRVPYVELHCHSAFSFLDGASHPVELAAAAAEQGHEALALTDHDGLHGAMELAQAGGAARRAADRGGGAHARRRLPPHAPVRGRRGLPQPLPADHPRARGHALGAPAREPHAPSVPLEDVERRAAGLVCLTGCAREGALARRVERGEHRGRPRSAGACATPSAPTACASSSSGPSRAATAAATASWPSSPSSLGVPCVATGNVHAHTRARGRLQDALVAVRRRTTLDESEAAAAGQLLARARLPDGDGRALPRPPRGGARVRPPGRSPALRPDPRPRLPLPRRGGRDRADRRLAELCRRGSWTSATPAAPAGGGRRAASRRELRSSASLGLSGFFLLHRDLLELAREVAVEVRGPDSARAVLPPGRGRGSSVSSIVCFLTGLSHVDPVENELLLGRFLNEEITALPDIDLDFPRDIREVLIPRVHERYGRERSALVASFATYRARSAVRDFGKALGLPVRATSSAWPAPSIPWQRKRRGARGDRLRGRAQRRARRAGARSSSSWRRPPGCRATSPSTPAAWSSPRGR